MVKASVSIVTYNNGKEIIKKLNSLISFFSDEFIQEIIIVDNNSTDDTLKKAEMFALKLSKVTIIPLTKNEGFGHGHNVAMQQSNSDYHLVMNLDVVPENPKVVSSMVKIMEDNYNIGLLSPLVKFPSGEIQLLTRNTPTVLDLAIRFLGPNILKKRQEKFVNLQTGYTQKQIIYNATGSFMFLRKKVIDQIGGFDERFFLYMEDTDLTRTINTVSEAWFYPQFVINHEWQRKNHSFKGSIQLMVSMIKYFNKWGWKFL